MTLKLPIKGLVARKGDYTVRYDAADRECPFALWRSETWLASYAKRQRAVEQMQYRIEMSQ